MGNALLYKYLDAELELRLATRATPSGWTFADLTRCGRAFPNCDIGVHAGDAASYEVFAALLDPIIAEVHGCELGRVVALGRSSSDLVSRPRLESNLRDDLAVLWTTVRVTRNLRSSHFPALMGRRARLEAERRIHTALESLGPRYDGRYYRLSELPSPRRSTLAAHNLYFDGDDRYLTAAGITRDWPEGRAIWSTDDRRLVVWVNEEDHLRILSRSPDGDLAACLARARELAWALEERLGFQYDERLGYLASCPSNVGTGLRASATLRLPRLAERPEELCELVEHLGLDLRGRRGERSELRREGPSGGGEASDKRDAVVDVANRRRLGASEAESVERLAVAVGELLAAERSTPAMACVRRGGVALDS
jgi:protein-arginine kinase